MDFNASQEHHVLQSFICLLAAMFFEEGDMCKCNEGFFLLERMENGKKSLLVENSELTKNKRRTERSRKGGKGRMRAFWGGLFYPW